jgi:hypothetical protein
MSPRWAENWVQCRIARKTPKAALVVLTKRAKWAPTRVAGEIATADYNKKRYDKGRTQP